MSVNWVLSEESHLCREKKLKEKREVGVYRKEMGCFSCMSPPSKDLRDYGKDMAPRSIASSG